jgi:DNA-binding transcriptional LysR family regulator
MLVQLEAMNPGCTFQIVTDHSAEILRKAEAHEVDLAVINSTGKGILLIREICGLYLSPKIEKRLSLAPDQPVTIRMLQEELFILSNTENIAGIIANQAFRREKIQPRNVTVVDNTQLALNMAAAMGGAAFIMKNYREDPHFHPLDPVLYNELRVWKTGPLEGIRLKGIRFDS